MYYQAVTNKYSVYPRQSLVQNIGHDGSGVHCDKSNRFHMDLLWRKERGFIFSKDLELNRKILIANQKFRKIDKHRFNSIDFLLQNVIYAGLRKIKGAFTGK